MVQLSNVGVAGAGAESVVVVGFVGEDVVAVPPVVDPLKMLFIDGAFISGSFGAETSGSLISGTEMDGSWNAGDEDNDDDDDDESFSDRACLLFTPLLSRRPSLYVAPLEETTENPSAKNSKFVIISSVVITSPFGIFGSFVFCIIPSILTLPSPSPSSPSTVTTSQSAKVGVPHTTTSSVLSPAAIDATDARCVLGVPSLYFLPSKVTTVNPSTTKAGSVATSFVVTVRPSCSLGMGLLDMMPTISSLRFKDQLSNTGILSS
mmetsp:Transcript_14929/g.22621  ORF Transcript_14929/g.22621 Transcript_14929/m.22621 type:complete len:263 (+) Transcript_14929:559-1347(+)